MSNAKHISNVIELSRVVVGSYKGLVAVRGVRQAVTDDEVHVVGHQSKFYTMYFIYLAKTGIRFNPQPLRSEQEAIEIARKIIARGREEFEWYAEKYKEGCRTQLDFLEAAFSHD